MVLDRNPDNYFAEVEQSAFEPNNMVPDRAQPGQDAAGTPVQLPRRPPAPHRRQFHAATHQRPALRPGAFLQPRRGHALRDPGDPVYAPNSFGGRWPPPRCSVRTPSWRVTGEILRSAYTLHKEDDDFGQANVMVNKAMDQAARQRLVSNVVGHASQDVTEPVLSRVVLLAQHRQGGRGPGGGGLRAAGPGLGRAGLAM